MNNDRSMNRLGGSSKITSSSDIALFDRSGLAALSDIETLEWGEIFSGLENNQKVFQNNEAYFRSKSLSCPSDPLHQWSRVWEYPYVYHHIKKLQAEYMICNKQLNVVDFGSGVTFFPFSIALLGISVNCIDIDPVVERDFNRAREVVPSSPGHVKFLLAENNKIHLPDKSVECIYSISVLEHIMNIEETLEEMARIMIPGGLLVLTIDLCAAGESEIKVSRYEYIRSLLSKSFVIKEPEMTIHPANLLNSSNGPYPIRGLSGLQLSYYKFKQQIKPLIGKKPNPPLLLYVFGGVYTKREH